MKDHDGSLPAFARGDVRNRLYRPLQAAVRFFRPPLPAPPTASLAGCLPNGQRYGLTMFRLKNTMG